MRRYIVTLPGRGYRFAAPVRKVTDGSEALVAEMRSRTEFTLEETVGEAGESVPALPSRASPRWNRNAPWALAAGMAIAAVAAMLLLRHPQRTPLGERDSVLVADFSNHTGYPVFDQALRQGLQVQLEQSFYLSLVSEGRIQQALHLMGQPPDTHITEPVARGICVRSGGAALLGIPFWPTQPWRRGSMYYSLANLCGIFLLLQLTLGGLETTLDALRRGNPLERIVRYPDR